VDALAGELLPWLRAERRIVTERDRAIVVGVSMGGLAAVFTALQRPDVFRGALSQSGAFQWALRDADDRRLAEPGRLMREVVAAAPRDLRFYLDAGLMEGERDLGWIPDDERDEPSLLAANRHIRDVLRARQGLPGPRRRVQRRARLDQRRGTLADGASGFVARARRRRRPRTPPRGVACRLVRRSGRAPRTPHRVPVRRPRAPLWTGGSTCARSVPAWAATSTASGWRSSSRAAARR